MVFRRFRQVFFYHSKSQYSKSLPNVSLQESLRSNELLNRLKNIYLNGKLVVDYENATDSLNAPKSLPMTQLPKDKIFMQVAQDDKIGSWRKSIVKWFRLGVFIVKYYKDGVKHTYLLARDTKPIVRQYGDDFAKKLCKRIEFAEIEHRLRKTGPEPINVLSLTRKQFVEFHRRKEVRKIPTFFILALVFEEFTAIICYLWPKVALHNCLTPGGFKKITKYHTNPELGRLTEIPTYKSPYTLPIEQVFAKLKSTSVEQTPRWKLAFYRFFNNEVLPRETLVKIHQYLFVDDWLLLQHILHNESTVLAPAELVDCIRLRQLYRSDEDINAMVSDSNGKRILVWRLLIYWAFRFDKTITCGGELLFSEKWGVNNVSILNHSGLKNGDLVDSHKLPILELR